MVGVAHPNQQPGSNYLEIAEEWKQTTKGGAGRSPGWLSADSLFDTTIFVKRSIEEVEETLLIAIGLVVIIIFIFSRDWLIAIRPLIDIPVSLIGTFYHVRFGFSIIVLTLLAIVLATGLVVDDGIVVTENIYKKIEKGIRSHPGGYHGL